MPVFVASAIYWTLVFVLLAPPLALICTVHTFGHKAPFMPPEGIILNSPQELSSCKGLKIVQLNCCSIVNKIDVIRHVLMSDLTIHVLCITESWFKPHHSADLFAIDQYHLFRLDRTRTSSTGNFVHGGGVACYIRDDIIVEQPNLNTSTIDLELLTICLLIQDRRKIFLCIIYRPPSGNYNVAINKLTDTVLLIRETQARHSLVIGGTLILMSQVLRIHRC